MILKSADLLCEINIITVEGGQKGIITVGRNGCKKQMVFRTALVETGLSHADVFTLSVAIERATNGQIDGVDLDKAVLEGLICKVGTKLKTFIMTNEDDSCVILDEVV